MLFVVAFLLLDAYAFPMTKVTDPGPNLAANDAARESQSLYNEAQANAILSETIFKDKLDILRELNRDIEIELLKGRQRDSVGKFLKTMPVAENAVRDVSSVFHAGNWKSIATAAASAVATAGIATFVALNLNRPPFVNDNATNVVLGDPTLKPNAGNAF